MGELTKPENNPAGAQPRAGEAEANLSGGLGIGKVYPAKSMFFRTHVGTADDGERKFEMATSMNGAPILQSAKTGKWFLLSWEDIISLADKAGIDA